MTDELELVTRYLAGDNQAGAALLALHDATLRKYARRYRRRGVELEDLLQEGKIEFLKEGIPNFDPALGSLGTYAMHWARKAMAKFLADNELTVRVPTNARRKDATESQKANALVARRTVSVDACLDASSSESPEDALHAARMKAATAKAVRNAVQTLPPAERYVLNRRLDSEESGELETLASIGDALGVSRERARQLEVQGHARILAKLCAMGVAEADEVEKAVR